MFFGPREGYNERVNNGKKISVFIADDSPLIRERLRSLLTEIPEVEVIGEAGNGVEALVSIHRIKPDVVILDIQMPGDSGIDIVRHLRKSGVKPVSIILTNYSYRHNTRASFEVGANYFLDKSRDFEKIKPIIGMLAVCGEGKHASSPPET